MFWAGAQAVGRRHRTMNMSPAESEVQVLQAAVDEDPRDPFRRCNLACVLASNGSFGAAMTQLAIAMEDAAGSIAAGCVTSAAREVLDEYANLWQLPKRPHLMLVGA
jgi:thioredoxin-like negative regulator of GroEL